MIKLSSSTEIWTSSTFSHPLILGSGPAYYFNHNKGKTPDQFICQFNNGGDIWVQVYDQWQNAVGSSYYGAHMTTAGTDLNTVEIYIHRYAAGDYRIKLFWFS